MTAWLIRRFIKNPENTGDQQVRQAYGTLGSITGMALNLFLSLIKILMGFLTGSVAVTADGINNLSDAGGSLIALIAVRMAQKPLDEDHPFGHGRIEYLGALSVGVLIAVFGVELMISSVESIFAPQATSFSVLTVVLLLLGVGIKLWMSRFFKTLGSKTDNPTLLATSQDSLSDAIATFAVFISAMLTLLLGWPIDGYVGALVSLLVLKAAFDVLKDTVGRLLGGKPDQELGNKLVEMLMQYPGILGVHDLVLHDYGPGRAFASVHAEISAASDLVAIHEVIDNAEREISQTLKIPVCIHMDPILTGDEKTEKAQKQMAEYLSSLTPPLKLHDFRRVPGEKHINLIFDVLLPPETRDTKALQDGISAHARTLDPRYRCVIQFDRDYFHFEAKK
ncbi:MAG: cation diffusion facilitator family transporter [Clostridiales bacterium]|nr:cation diffusion facilitator family transporter [Clostridiales bacterium]